MKSNKELILEALKRQTLTKHKEGVSTLYLAKELDIQRPNVSSVLSKLIEEDLVEKSGGRPVLYRLKQTSKNGEQSSFSHLIGVEGSLRNAVQLAKASILYPESSLPVLITGPSGSGKSLFSKLMYRYAIEQGIQGKQDPYVKFNCKNYTNKEDTMHEDLFGKEGVIEKEFFNKDGRGVLFVDHIDCLSVNAKTKLFEWIDLGYIENEQGQKRFGISLILACNDNVNRSILESYIAKIPIKIELPMLSNRPMNERFELIQQFFTHEAIRIKKNIVINSQLLRCLLLYDCLLNVNQLKHDIQLGCANAFVRDFHVISDTLEVYISDMEHYVRKGFLKYKRNRSVLESIIPDNYNYTFTSSGIDRNVDISYYAREKNIYEMIEEKASELSKRSIDPKDIGLLMSIEVENSFRLYRSKLSQKVVNKEQLSKLVSDDIMELVETFLQEASLKFDVDYPAAVFYGLCLHLNATIERLTNAQPLSNKQITDVVEQYKDEYAFSLQFANKIEEKLRVQLPIDEVVLITMFICNYEQHSETTSAPVILVALHGEGVASSLAQVINLLVKCNNVYGYDLSLDKNSEELYGELKERMRSIHQGKGMIVIYDMGSIHTMGEMIAEESELEVRFIKMPITLVGLEASRKAALGEGIDSIADTLQQNLKEMFQHVETKHMELANKCILTLCNTGEGGALEMKHYLERSPAMQNIEVVALAITDRNQLREQVANLMQSYDILCCIGTYNPNLFELPFVSIATLFSSPIEDLGKMLHLGLTNRNTIDYDEIYTYLSQELEVVDMDKIKKIMPDVMEGINNLIDGNLSVDQELGLFMHIVSSMNRMMLHEKMPVNVKKELILKKYNTLFKSLLKVLKPLEKNFQIIFSDDECANIISIIKKI